jgi:hypothetical protein
LGLKFVFAHYLSGLPGDEAEMIAHLREVEEMPLAEADMVDGTMRLALCSGLRDY